MIEKGIAQIESLGYYRSPKYSSLQNLRNDHNMYSAVRVLLFMSGIFLIPSILLIIPLYLRHRIFADVTYSVTESDVFEINEGISPVFCQAHTMRMNTSFNAYKINVQTVDITHKKHFRLRKSMSLPDDSLEYWGFFLNKGSTVSVSLCSRHTGGRIMVVKDIKNLHTCGLLVHEKNLNKTIVFSHRETVNITNEQIDDEEYEGEDVSRELTKKKKRLLKSTEIRYENLPPPVTGSSSTDGHLLVKRSVGDVESPPLSNPPTEYFLHGKTDDKNDSSDSSFEQSLIACHRDRILFNTNFTNSNLCNNNEYVENGTHTRIRHDIFETGYYFYIFYSDNDDYFNEMHSIFDIYKPTYEYDSTADVCLNKTECTFPLQYLSNGRKVVVEIPAKNEIFVEHEDEIVMKLVSTCEPRTMVYTVFPITALISILVSALMGSSTNTR